MIGRFARRLACIFVCAIALAAPVLAQQIPNSGKFLLPDGSPQQGVPILIPTSRSTSSAVNVWDGTVGVRPRTIVPLDVATVTTGGTAVVALAAGHKTAGGWILNPSTSVALCINEIGTASGTTSAGNTTCIQPGQVYALTPSAGAVSVVSSDSSHPFSGQGWQ